MVMCYVPDCKHYSERDFCSFFRFPQDEKNKKTWLKNIRRADKSPSISSRICCCHFKDRLKANGPTIFERNKNKLMMFGSPEKKQKNPIIFNFKRKNGNLWQPSNQSRMGSAHCVGGKKSSNINHLGYIPKVFPQIYNKPAFNQVARADMYLRFKKGPEVDAEEIGESPNDQPAIPQSPSFSSSGTQTDLRETSDYPGVPVLFCSNTAENVGCQTNIPIVPVPPVEPNHYKILKSTGVSENNVKITNVQSVTSSEHLNCVSPEKETNQKKSCDSTFYKKSMKIQKREESFGKFVASEMSELRVNPELYLKTQQSVLKLLVEAQFEQMSSSNGA